VAPHFLELDQAGFSPPFRAFDGLARVGRALQRQVGAAGAALFLACLGLVAGLALGLAARGIRDDVAWILAPATDESREPGRVGLFVGGAPGVGLVLLLVGAIAAGHGLGMRGDVALVAAASVAVIAFAFWSLQRLALRR
jgi:hypothetical protein